MFYLNEMPIHLFVFHISHIFRPNLNRHPLDYCAIQIHNRSGTIGSWCISSSFRRHWFCPMNHNFSKKKSIKSLSIFIAIANRNPMKNLEYKNVVIRNMKKMALFTHYMMRMHGHPTNITVTHTRVIRNCMEWMIAIWAAIKRTRTIHRIEFRWKNNRFDKIGNKWAPIRTFSQYIRMAVEKKCPILKVFSYICE